MTEPKIDIKKSNWWISEDWLPKAVREEIMKLGELEIKIHILDDWRRIIDWESMADIVKLLTK